MKIKINKAIRGYQPGAIIKIKTDRHGVPLERYWRDRMKDAPIDGCIEIIKEV